MADDADMTKFGQALCDIAGVFAIVFDYQAAPHIDLFICESGIRLQE